MNPLLCWRAVCGVEVWHKISHWGKENFSSRMVTRLSPVSPSEACLPYPSSQGASYTQFPSVLPKISSLINHHISQPFFYPDPHKICQGRLNQTVDMSPLYSSSVSSENENSGGHPVTEVWGLGWRWAVRPLGPLAPLSTKTSLAKRHRTNPTLFGPQFPLPSLKGKEYSFFLSIQHCQP